MKTKGKLAMGQKNDFDIVAVQLTDGLSRLTTVRDKVKLSAEQEKVVDSAFKQIETLQAAMKECGDVERFILPEARNEQIGQVMANYNIQELNGFDDVLKLFGNPERSIERGVSGIDRNQAVADLVSQIQGTEAADYQLS